MLVGKGSLKISLVAREQLNCNDLIVGKVVPKAAPVAPQQ